MRLCFDIGNTRAKCALYDGERLVDQGLVTEAFVSTLLRHYGHDITDAVASVVGPEPDWERLLPEGLALQRISAQSRLPFRLDYKTPETLGADRLAVLCGALHRGCADNNLLVVDAGTCVTIDHLEEGIYRGGVIMPGIQMMLQAMHEHTARLPHLIYAGQPVAAMGKSTEECLLSGAVVSIANAINGYCQRLASPAILLTGGDAPWLMPHIEHPATECKDLLFEGLNHLQL